MKKMILSSFLIVLGIFIHAQVPQKMSYQAVIRNSSDQLVTNHAVGMRISILQNSATGTPIYVETHTTTTNANGLATLEIGVGTTVTGTFAGIVWSAGSYFIKTETDPTGGTNYTITGTSQILSVPYSFYANSAGNGFSGAWNDLTGKPSFSTVATTGSFADLLSKPTTLAGYGITDADNSLTNEIQSLSINGSQLNLSNGGGTVTLPTSDGLTLPYNGSTSATYSVFQITNYSTENSSAITGRSASTINITKGVEGYSASTSGQGVFGSASAVTGYTSGVFGVSSSTTGSGVTGFSSSSSGRNYGLRGESASSSGSGVQGYASSESGETYGVWGEVASPTGYSGFFAGGKFYVSGNVGLGNIDPSVRLDVNGQVRITGGSPGAGKVLTSDATGLASWQAAAAGPWQVNNEKIYYNGGNVGIGISNPYYKFEIYDDNTAYQKFLCSASGTGIADGLLVGLKGPENTSYFWSAENGDINIGTNNTLAIKIRPNGDVGLGGVIIPDAKFEVNGQVKIDGGSPGTGKVLTSDWVGLAFWETPAFITSGTDAYFTGSGNVGIGNPTPAYKLDVTGNRIRLAQGTEWIAMRTDGSTGFLDLSFSGGKLAIGGTNTGENILLNPGTNAWVGVRTWNPQYELDVTGNIRATGSVYYGGTAGAANGTAYTKPVYVFSELYQPLSIVEISEFLNKENHLPWITSATQEKKENGNVTDMTRMAFETVETVENLQLQIIEMFRKIETLNELVQKQQKELDTFKDKYR